MPIFEFKCKVCGKVFEVYFLKKEANPPKTCAVCGGKVEQIPSTPSQFQWGKGGSWQK